MLINSHDSCIDKAYIICLQDNATSQTLARTCMESCQRVGQPYEIWPAFDGTSASIKIPDFLQSQSWLKWMRVYDHWLSLAEVATCLSHISVWVRCMDLDKPVIVLEHDAVMLKPLARHRYYNTIQYLGCKQQLMHGEKLDQSQSFSTINQNWMFINRAHAYSIDPAVARRLFGLVLERGIFESLDVMIMADVFAIVQDGIYAYDEPMGQTTILTRKQSQDHGAGQIKL